MNNEELQALVLQSLVEEISTRVAQKLAERQKRALVVYTGSTMSFDPALESLAKLRTEGFRFDVFLSQGAVELLDIQKIQAALQPERTIIGNADGAPEALAIPFSTILVPAMTINTAAKLANCMADSPAARIISNSMMRGKNVVMALDGCCPDNPARWEKGYRMTEALKARLRENLDTLRSFGASVTTADRLAEKTLKLIGGSSLSAAVSVAQPAAVCTSAPIAEQRTGRKVLGRGDIASCLPNSILHVRKGTLVTQLAREVARAQGVTILYE